MRADSSLAYRARPVHLPDGGRLPAIRTAWPVHDGRANRRSGNRQGRQGERRGRPGAIELRALGADVQVVTAYRTVLPSGDSSELKDRFRRHDIHVITFTSSSTVRNFRRLFDSGEEMKKLTEGTVVACIGPITAKTAREQGLHVTMTAAQNTVPALVEAIVQYFSTGAPGRRRGVGAQER